MSYVSLPIETEPQDLLDEMITFLQDALPGWEPHEGNLEVVVLAAAAQIAAEIRELATDVPGSIFRYYGETILGLPPALAQSASISSTWTMVDDAGYTIPVGTLVAIPATGDSSIAFEVIEEVSVLAGATVTETGEVTLVAVQPGTVGNDLGGSAALLDPLDFVASVAVVGTSTAGVDGESDDAYQDRLSALLQLLAPRPIVAADFAVLAQTVPGVERALAIDAGDVVIGEVNEIQSVDIRGAIGGTFTLTYAGQTTAAISYNASAALIRAALESLSNISPGDVAVSGGPANTAVVYVEFTGALAATDVAQITGSGTNLITAQVNERQMVFVNPGQPASGTFTLTFSGQTTAAIAWNASAATVQAALEALSNIAPGDVAVSIDPASGAYFVDFIGAYLGTNVGQMTADGSGLPGAGSSVTVSTIRNGSTTTGMAVATATTQVGGDIVAPQERTVVVASVDASGEPSSNTIKNDVIDLLAARREVNFVVLVIDAGYSTIKVTAAATALPGYDPIQVQAAAEAALADYLSPANWGQPPYGDKRAWVKEDTVYRGELYTVLNAVEGLDVVTTLTLAKGAGALGTADVTLDGQAPLTRPGAITVTVSAP
jgi:hypothetical protein